MTTFTFFLLSLLHLAPLKQTSCSFKCLYHSAHFLFTLALSFGLLIFLIFWAVLVPYAAHSEGHMTVTFEWLMFSQHFITQMLIVIDFVLCGGQFHKPHILFVLIVGALYLVVNACVSLNIFVVYPILTWRDGMTALWVTVCIILIVSFFFLFYCLGTRKENQLAETQSLIQPKKSAISYEEVLDWINKNVKASNSASVFDFPSELLTLLNQ